ncbi:hypothetical protein CR513_13716, partial [Mucuna pruriens]
MSYYVKEREKKASKCPGYSSNFKTIVLMQDLKLVGLKSHDCHVLMQQLLPMTICDILEKNVRKFLTRLCLFFNAICSKVINPQKLDELENEVVIILCQVERYMKILKSYMSTAKSVEVPKSRHESIYGGKGTSDVIVKSMGQEEVLQAHLYILNNIKEVQPYLSTHQDILKKKNPRRNEKKIINEHNKTFLNLFKGQILNNTQDNKSTMQNNGVMVMAESMHFSTLKYKNSVMAFICYFGEVDYTKFRVSIFKSKWVDSNTSVQIDELGFTLVDLDKVGYKGESFIMTSHAKQVWLVILQQRSMHRSDKNQDTSFDLTNTPFSTHMPTLNDRNEVNNVHSTCHDHIEGLWENIKKGRWITRLRDIILCRNEDMLIVVEFDHLANPIGEVGMQFKSFVAIQTRICVKIMYTY